MCLLLMTSVITTYILAMRYQTTQYCPTTLSITKRFALWTYFQANFFFVQTAVLSLVHVHVVQVSKGAKIRNR